MRGTLSPTKYGHYYVGIIPAYAGNTRLHACGGQSARDHPRVCGEHLVIYGRPTLVPGSSPRMRGTRCGMSEQKTPVGIIPAYAGNTSAANFSTPRLRDHPRVCGEHFFRLAADKGLQGSSPRMRGTQHARVDVGGSRGIIPAYAGNTSSLSSTMSGVGDHPRVCGEHLDS